MTQSILLTSSTHMHKRTPAMKCMDKEREGDLLRSTVFLQEGCWNSRQDSSSGSTLDHLAQTFGAPYGSSTARPLLPSESVRYKTCYQSQSGTSAVI
jgi:hypothetical protein